MDMDMDMDMAWTYLETYTCMGVRQCYDGSDMRMSLPVYFRLTPVYVGLGEGRARGWEQFVLACPIAPILQCFTRTSSAWV